MPTDDRPNRAEPPKREERPPDDEIRVRRAAHRGSYDRDTIERIVDAALIAHVATVRDGKPVVIPMLAARDGDWLLLHGSPAAGTIRRSQRQPVCVAMTLLDGLVLARSAFHHSLNYRSVVIHGEAEPISDERERARALEVFVEHLTPGRGAQLRATTSAEVKQTAVLRISLAQASAKVRNGPPSDDEDDYALPIWAGVLPVSTNIGRPEMDPRLAPDIEMPQQVRDLADTSR